MRDDIDEQEVAREILGKMPQTVSDIVHRPAWGNVANRLRAFAQANRMGFSFDSTCSNCDADVYVNLRLTAKHGIHHVKKMKELNDDN